jgi:hypothetical protein
MKGNHSRYRLLTKTEFKHILSSFYSTLQHHPLLKKQSSVLALLTFVLLVIGFGTSFFLSRQIQELRQRAQFDPYLCPENSVCKGGTGCTPGAEEGVGLCTTLESEAGVCCRPVDRSTCPENSVCKGGTGCTPNVEEGVALCTTRESDAGVCCRPIVFNECPGESSCRTFCFSNESPVDTCQLPSGPGRCCTNLISPTPPQCPPTAPCRTFCHVGEIQGGACELPGGPGHCCFASETGTDTCNSAPPTASVCYGIAVGNPCVQFNGTCVKTGVASDATSICACVANTPGGSVSSSPVSVSPGQPTNTFVPGGPGQPSATSASSNQPTNTPVPVNPGQPTNTSVPLNTATPTSIQNVSASPIVSIGVNVTESVSQSPTQIISSILSATLQPTNTSVPTTPGQPTNTPVPLSTFTTSPIALAASASPASTLRPTNTSVPTTPGMPTNTPVPLSTLTPTTTSTFAYSPDDTTVTASDKPSEASTQTQYPSLPSAGRGFRVFLIVLSVIVTAVILGVVVLLIFL